jgi:hypothetical protein
VSTEIGHHPPRQQTQAPAWSTHRPGARLKLGTDDARPSWIAHAPQHTGSQRPLRSASESELTNEDPELTQKDIPNLSARQVRRIEKGETSPRTDSLRAFADAHGLEINDYLNRVAEEMRRMRRNLSDG